MVPFALLVFDLVAVDVEIVAYVRYAVQLIVFAVGDVLTDDVLVRC